jgi:hypothetical protein
LIDTFYLHRLNLDSQASSGILNFASLSGVLWPGWFPQKESHPRDFGGGLLQQFQPLAG